MQTRPARIIAALVFVWAVVIQCPALRATTHHSFGPIGNPNFGNNVTYNYIETEFDFTLLLSGGPVIIDENFEFDVGEFWGHSVIIDLHDGNLIGDEPYDAVFLLGISQHQVIPPGLAHIDDAPEGDSVLWSVTMAAQPPNPPSDPPPGAAVKSHPPHEDHYSWQGLVDSDPLFNNVPITAWSVEVKGVHTVPEPASWCLAVIGFGSFAFLYHRRKRAAE